MTGKAISYLKDAPLAAGIITAMWCINHISFTNALLATLTGVACSFLIEAYLLLRKKLEDRFKPE